jgi:hypothetical protein
MAWNPNSRALKPRPERRSEPAAAPAQQYDPAEIVAANCRLQAHVAYLEGYTLETLERARTRDITPKTESEAEPVSSDLESDGNLVCLPGVTLASVKGSALSDGDDPGPAAA